MYETKPHPQAPTKLLRRLILHLLIALGLLVVSLAAGMWGYEHYESLLWRDAFLNAAMLLGGMGPVDPLKTDAGKLFAGIYALYAGLVFILSAALVSTPILHYFLHKFHWDDKL